MLKQFSSLKNTKFQRRLNLILSHSLKTILLMAFGPVISFLVIRFSSIELWGSFVNILIIVQLASHIIAWGNKEYLLRAFSRNPTEIRQTWQNNLATRLILMIGFCLISPFFFTLNQIPYILLWTAGLVLTQACDALILYRKNFITATIVEAIGLISLTMLTFWFRQTLSLENLLIFFSLTNFLKAILLIFVFYKDTLLKLTYIQLETYYFIGAFPFFLLGFTGLLKSRIDLYSVIYFLPEETVGQYQVFNNFIVYVQSVSAFVLMPFVKNIYRLQNKTILKLSPRLFGLGIIIIVPALISIQLILTYLYHFNLPTLYFILGGLSILPIYFFLPIIYALYKEDLQNNVLYINFGTAIIILIFNLLLIPSLEMLGAIISVTIANWLTFGIYLIQQKRIQGKHVFTMPKLSSDSQ